MKYILWKSLLLISVSIFSLNTYAAWQCYAADKKGHMWTSEGLSQENANTVALSFCQAYSPNSSSCHATNCIPSNDKRLSLE